MRKPIISGGECDITRSDRFIRGRRSEDENHKLCFPGRWQYSIKIHM